MGLHAPCPVHFGIDNAAVVRRIKDMKGRAADIIEEAAKKNPDKQPTQQQLKQIQEMCPYKKSWMKQKDGDLWQILWKSIIAKNPEASHQG